MKGIVENMAVGLFDPITNSEDAMIARVGIERYHACIYLRAYIMAFLCFESPFIVSYSSANLNKAFRLLIDYRESKGDYNVDFLPKADFKELIYKGYIRFVARRPLEGNFFETLRVSQQWKKAVNLPSEQYTRMLYEICPNEYVYDYSLDHFLNCLLQRLKIVFCMN